MTTHIQNNVTDWYNTAVFKSDINKKYKLFYIFSHIEDTNIHISKTVHIMSTTTSDEYSY